jgi:predicted Zn-dependent protease
MRRAATLSFLVAVLGGCATLQAVRSGDFERATRGDLSAVGNVAKAVGTDAKPIVDLLQELTPENEYYVGRTVAVRVLGNFEYRYRTQDYPAGPGAAGGELRAASLTEYLNQISLVLADAALERADRKGDRPAPLAGFHVVVVESEQLNAFAAPGGFIFVTTGTLKAAHSEDELACVLAHEVAHVVRGHALGSVQRSRWANVPAEWLKSSKDLTPEQRGALQKMFEGTIGDILDALLVKGYSRDTEYEADALGAKIAQAAGYDPNALVSFLATVKSRGEGGAGGAKASHGSPAERIERLRTLPVLASAKNVGGARAQRFGQMARLLQ